MVRIPYPEGLCYRCYMQGLIDAPRLPLLEHWLRDTYQAGLSNGMPQMVLGTARLYIEFAQDQLATEFVLKYA